MTLIRTDPPADNAEVRRALYAGTVFRLAPTPTSTRLVAEALALLEAELADVGPIREAQFRLSNDEFFRRMGRLRKKLYTEPRYHQAVRDLVTECGFDARRTAFDPIRLRVVMHRGHENPRAAPVYYAHRDTWYANPQAQITWWVPLHDLAEAETFLFYPDYFAAPVPNNSEEFDYDDWMRNGSDLKIGWQDPDAGTTANYPGFGGGARPERVVSFACRAAEVVLFAGAHFHQTRHNETGRTRFSLDVRTVHLDDRARGVGAPNVDNRSTGSAARDYVQPL